MKGSKRIVIRAAFFVCVPREEPELEAISPFPQSRKDNLYGIKGTKTKIKIPAPMNL